MDQKYLKELFRDTSRSIVGKLCSQNEILQSRADLSEFQKFEILKNLNRELIYQEFRTLSNHIKAYESGQKFRNFNITPLNQPKVV